jgi:hypothetical protein
MANEVSNTVKNSRLRMTLAQTWRQHCNMACVAPFGPGHWQRTPQPSYSVGQASRYVQGDDDNARCRGFC